MRRTGLLALAGFTAACAAHTPAPARRGPTIATDETGTERRAWEWGIPACSVTMREGKAEPIVYHRDAAGRIVRIDRYGRVDDRRGFDATGRWVVQEHGNDFVVRTYEHGRLAAVDTRSDKRTLHERIRRDAAGRVVARTFPALRDTWTYDDRGRVVHMWQGQGDRRTNEWTWEWDATGHLTVAIGLAITSGAPTWSREELTWEGDRVVASRRTIDAWPDYGYLQRFRYDAAGRVIEVAAANADPISTTTYTWDGILPLEITEVRRNGTVGQHTRFEYAGGIVTRRDSNGTVARTLEDTCPPSPDAERIPEIEMYFVVDPLPRTAPTDPES